MEEFVMEMGSMMFKLELIWSLLRVLIVVFSLLFMHFSAKHRNQKLSAAWYVCGVIFGFWTLIVFLVKRKDFPGENMKVCPQCGVRYPENFVVCSNCVIDLPENISEEKQKQKTLSRLFALLLVLLYVAEVVVAIVVTLKVKDFVAEELFNTNYRISVDGVFYDKKGNSYEDENDVLLYDENGGVYKYVEIGKDYENDLDFEAYYVRDDGERFYSFDCYVSAEGWFYYDMGELMYYYETESDTDIEYSEYKYYNLPYVDYDGNLYFDAFEASWNEKGELITAENDIY